jgi:hypothetical protein
VTRWEYRSLSEPQQPGHTLEDRLNALGAEGWELVSLHISHGHFWCLLKRAREHA